MLQANTILDLFLNGLNATAIVRSAGYEVMYKPTNSDGVRRMYCELSHQEMFSRKYIMHNTEVLLVTEEEKDREGFSYTSKVYVVVYDKDGNPVVDESDEFIPE